MAAGCIIGSTCNSNDLLPSAYTTYTLNDEDPYDCYTYIVGTSPGPYTLYRGNSPMSCTTKCVETAETYGSTLVYFRCYEYTNGNNENAASIDMTVTKIGCSVVSSTQTSIASTVTVWYLSSWQWAMAALSCLVLAVFILAATLLVILIIAVCCWRKKRQKHYIHPA